MNAKELFQICTETTDCEGCPYNEKEPECKVVNDAIHMLRHPEWYVNKNNQILLRMDATNINNLKRR